MNPKLKTILTITAKQAVGAVVGNAVLAQLFPQVLNFHDWTHALAFLKTTGAFVAGAEAKVWIPKLLAWVNSPTLEG